MISDLYDPMVAKLIVWDEDRDLARRRMLRALGEFEVGGVATLIPLHQAIMAPPRVRRRRHDARLRRGRRLRRCIRGARHATFSVNIWCLAPNIQAPARGRGRREAVRGRRSRCPSIPAGRGCGSGGRSRRPRGHGPGGGRRRSQPDAGQRAAGCGRRRRPGGGRPGAGGRRGDEDGERDRRAARGRDRGGRGRRGRSGRRTARRSCAWREAHSISSAIRTAHTSSASSTRVWGRSTSMSWRSFRTASRS